MSLNEITSEQYQEYLATGKLPEATKPKPKPKPPKYRNQKVEKHGRKWDSLAELNHYEYLLQREKAGEIHELEVQPRFTFTHNGIKICTYRADFSYRYTGSDKREVVDVKSPITAKHPVYRIKNKMMRAFFGIDIVEVMNR